MGQGVGSTIWDVSQNRVPGHILTVNRSLTYNTAPRFVDGAINRTANGLTYYYIYDPSGYIWYNDAMGAGSLEGLQNSTFFTPGGRPTVSYYYNGQQVNSPVIPPMPCAISAAQNNQLVCDASPQWICSGFGTIVAPLGAGPQSGGNTDWWTGFTCTTAAFIAVPVCIPQT